jgi:hypothetical protein
LDVSVVQSATKATIDAEAAKDAKKQYFSAALAAFAFQRGVSYFDTLLAMVVE